MRPEIVGLVAREIAKARTKHGMSIESYDNGLRLAVLTEEVGEVARALCDLRLAEDQRDKTSRTGNTAELEAARREVERAREHVFEELVQVAACAARWLETRG